MTSPAPARVRADVRVNEGVRARAGRGATWGGGKDDMMKRWHVEIVDKITTVVVVDAANSDEAAEKAARMTERGEWASRNIKRQSVFTYTQRRLASDDG